MRQLARSKAGTLRTNQEHVLGLDNIPQAFCDFIGGRFAARLIIGLE